MPIEDLQRQWRRLEQKLDQSLALETELVRRAIVQPARRRIHRLAFWPAIDVAFGVGVLLFVGDFLSRHGHDARLAGLALVVALSSLALVIDSVRQLVRIAGVDWSGPVAAIQCSLAKLRAARIRQFQWVILLAPLVGFCVFVVGLQSVISWVSDGRSSVIDKLDARWVIANLIFGLLFVPCGYWLGQVLASWGRRRGWWQAVLDDVSGRSLAAVTRDLEDWTQLEQTSQQVDVSEPA
jgi:Tfp pilus assembly protein PilN